MQRTIIIIGTILIAMILVGYVIETNTTVVVPIDHPIAGE
jgi:hypothetical protein